MSDPNKHPNFQRTYQNPQSSLRQTGTRTVHIQSSLHPKKVQNNPPQNIKFANREGNIRINDIANLDLNNVIKTNNIMPLEQFAENLIYADINPDDYEDKNLVKLIKAFQYGLEYLYKKQNDLDKQNETLANEYNELINESYDIERRLKENKQKISKYNSEKKERLMLINTYSSIINYHCNPIEEENIVIKQIEKINKENSGARYYCHICSGKPFSSEEKLESHMKRRHNAQARYNINNPMEESFENYERKINEMKEYFENLMKNKENEKIKQNDYKDDLERLKEENNKKFRNMEDELRNTLDNFRKFLQNSQQQQIQIKEQPTTIQNSQIDQFSSLKQSIEKLGSLIQEQNNEKIKEMEKQIEDLKKNQYKYNNSSINKKEDIKINISDNRKKDSFPINSFQKQELKNTQYEAPLVNEIIIKDNIPTIKGDEEKEKEVIIPEKKSETTNFRVIKKSELQESNQEISTNKLEDKKIDPVIQENTIILNSQINSNDLKQDNILLESNNDLKISGNALLPNAPKLNQTEEIPKKKNKKFKKIQTKAMNKTMENMTKEDELELFFANFTNRDNEIFEEEEPKINQIQENVIPDDPEFERDDNILTQTLTQTINKKAKDENIEFEDYLNKSKRELIDIIDKTLKQINEANQENEMKSFYYNTTQKALDMKIYENDKELMKQNLGKKNIKKSKVNSIVDDEFI